MTNQEEYNIRMSIKDKIKRKGIPRFISVTQIDSKELLEIIFSFLKLKDKVLNQTISYKISIYSNKESDVIACGILSGGLNKLVDFFIQITKSLNTYQYYNVEIIDLNDE